MNNCKDPLARFVLMFVVIGNVTVGTSLLKNNDPSPDVVIGEVYVETNQTKDPFKLPVEYHIIDVDSGYAQYRVECSNGNSWTNHTTCKYFLKGKMVVPFDEVGSE